MRQYRNTSANTLQRGELIYLRIKVRLYKELRLLEVTTQIKLVINKKFREYKMLEYKNYRESFRL